MRSIKTTFSTAGIFFNKFFIDTNFEDGTLVKQNISAFRQRNAQVIKIDPKQTWKKLQVVQAALADFLSEITLF